MHHTCRRPIIWPGTWDSISQIQNSEFKTPKFHTLHIRIGIIIISWIITNICDINIIPEKQEEMFVKSRRCFLMQGVFVKSRRCLWKAGGVCEQQGVFVKSKECLWKAGSVREKQEVFVKSRGCLWTTGGVCEKQGVFVKSRECLWKAGGVCEKQGVFVKSRGCLWKAGGVCEKQEVFVKSRGCLLCFPSAQRQIPSPDSLWFARFPLIRRFPSFITWPSLILCRNTNACIIIYYYYLWKAGGVCEKQGVFVKSRAFCLIFSLIEFYIEHRILHNSELMLCSIVCLCNREPIWIINSTIHKVCLCTRSLYTHGLIIHMVSLVCFKLMSSSWSGY